MSTSKIVTRPHGRDQVVDALLDAATRLFAAHGPGAVSLRDVTREAGVNLGLIHRHIGGKQDLLARVLARRPDMPTVWEEDQYTPAELVDSLLPLIARDSAYTRIILRATLDGYDVPQLPVAFPLVQRSAVSLRASLPRDEANVHVAMLTAAIVGWQVLGPMVLGVLDQRDLTPDELSAALRPALHAYLSAEPA